MKKFYLSILILCIIFSQALSQWRIALSSTYPSGTTFQSLYFVNENVGWAVGSDGMILKTTNGGISGRNKRVIPRLLFIIFKPSTKIT